MKLMVSQLEKIACKLMTCYGFEENFNQLVIYSVFSVFELSPRDMEKEKRMTE